MYTWNGMKKITFEEAIKYYRGSSVEVYLLFDDDTESLVTTEREIEVHYDKGGENGFGVHIEDY